MAVIAVTEMGIPMVLHHGMTYSAQIESMVFNITIVSEQDGEIGFLFLIHSRRFPCCVTNVRDGVYPKVRILSLLGGLVSTQY